MVAEKKDADVDVKTSVAADAVQETGFQEAIPAAASFGSSFLCVSAETTITAIADAETTAATAAGFL